MRRIYSTYSAATDSAQGTPGLGKALRQPVAEHPPGPEVHDLDRRPANAKSRAATAPSLGTRAPLWLRKQIIRIQFPTYHLLCGLAQAKPHLLVCKMGRIMVPPSQMLKGVTGEACQKQLAQCLRE